MPHQCTNCGHVFPDGSKEMLSGCPDCGGNKFQFKQGEIEDINAEADEAQATLDDAADEPTGTADTAPDTTAATDSPPETEPSDASTPAAPDAPAANGPASDATDAEVMASDQPDGAESPAQSTARSDVVSPDELPDSSSPSADDTAESTSQSTASDQPTAAGDAAAADTDATAADTDSPAEAEEATSSSLDQLRQELNDQFESIRIVSPGQYELNLMELYDRNEYIISLREDGRYVIEVPDGWGADEPT
jgi:predicted  nucleic acid-binding Zn-ribbon protein